MKTIILPAIVIITLVPLLPDAILIRCVPTLLLNSKASQLSGIEIPYRGTDNSGMFTGWFSSLTRRDSFSLVYSPCV